MKISFTGVISWESRVDRISGHYTANAAAFAPRFYGAEVTSIALLLMCVEPAPDFQRRVRFRRKDAEFYTDILLDLAAVVPLTMKQKMRYVSQQVMEQLSEQLNKRRFKDFDHLRFLQDLQEWLEEIESRYDGQTTGAWRYASGE
ncbi:TPA: hypothetical protein QDZ42_000068 [Stenotrophomonas maltophilia]|nr:hypothetical protein [Stenotrophomonas maltophilia]HDS1041474.1 hypothetical protein [Stenotrophomonas maltophilia]